VCLGTIEAESHVFHCEYIVTGGDVDVEGSQ
jgi:hypothetical protein